MTAKLMFIATTPLNGMVIKDDYERFGSMPACGYAEHAGQQLLKDGHAPR